MHWPARGTDSTPTEPGWYWHRVVSDGEPAQMRHVGVWPGDGKLVTKFGGSFFPVNRIGGQWVRVPLPEEWEPPPASRDDPPGFSTQPERP